MTDKITTYKGFDENLQCLGFKYELGCTYKHDGKVVRCAEGGFHSCEYPLDIFSYYEPCSSRYCVVEVGGDIDRCEDDSKIASAEITIKAEISLPELVQKSVDWIMSKVSNSDTNHATDDKSSASNTGNYSAASNTGDYSAASNTGYYSAASNTGYYSAASNTGDYSAASNTGNYSAASNTGYRSAASNTGNRSAASNTGDYSAASVSGENSVAIASGLGSRAKASEGSAIVLVYRDEEWNLIHIKSGIAGKDVKPDTWYTLNELGEFIADQSDSREEEAA